jgi:hypothetical protein
VAARKRPFLQRLLRAESLRAEPLRSLSGWVRRLLQFERPVFSFLGCSVAPRQEDGRGSRMAGVLIPHPDQPAHPVRSWARAARAAAAVGGAYGPSVSCLTGF